MMMTELFFFVVQCFAFFCEKNDREITLNSDTSAPATPSSTRERG